MRFFQIQPLVLQCLARLFISVNPGLVKDGQVKESVLALLKLFQTNDNLYKFEAVLAITNVASVSEELRKFIIDTKVHHNMVY